MKNSDKFQEIFGLYATEVWAMPEEDFLEWLNAVCDTYERDHHGWHPFRQEQDPETGLWKIVDPPADWQHILITVNMSGHEPVQEDYWYGDVYGYLDSGYTPCAEAIAWMALPEPYVPDTESGGWR